MILSYNSFPLSQPRSQGFSPCSKGKSPENEVAIILSLWLVDRCGGTNQPCCVKGGCGGKSEPISLSSDCGERPSSLICTATDEWLNWLVRLANILVNWKEETSPELTQRVHLLQNQMPVLYEYRGVLARPITL